MSKSDRLRLRDIVGKVPGDTENRAFWERFCALYPLAMTKNDAAYDEIASHAKMYLTSTSRVIEMGCGTGQLASRLAPEVASWLATDFSPNMVEEAREAHLPANVTLEVANATDMPYASASCDAVVAANVLHVMPHPEIALREAKRLLAPGGVLIAPTFIYRGHRPHFTIWLMERAGLKTFNRWSKNKYIACIEQSGFEIIEAPLVKGKPLNECAVIARVRP